MPHWTRAASAQGPCACVSGCLCAAVHVGPRSHSPLCTRVRGSPVPVSLHECPPVSSSMCFLHATGIRACKVPGAGLGRGAKVPKAGTSPFSQGTDIWGWRETDKIDKYIYRLWEVLCRGEV